jgi:hypothetical protein
MRKRIGVYKVLGRARRRWKNIKLISKKTVGCVGWFDLAQDRGQWRDLVNESMKL